MFEMEERAMHAKSDQAQAPSVGIKLKHEQTYGEILMSLFFFHFGIFFNWEFIFQMGKKLNLALGMGPNIGPVRALEKGLSHE